MVMLSEWLEQLLFLSDEKLHRRFHAVATFACHGQTEAMAQAFRQSWGVGGEIEIKKNLRHFNSLVGSISVSNRAD